MTITHDYNTSTVQIHILIIVWCLVNSFIVLYEKKISEPLRSKFQGSVLFWGFFKNFL